MNTRTVIENYISPTALSVAFNQDSSCFSIGQESGFSVFNSNPCQLQVQREFGAGISIVQMLGKSNIIGMVGGGKQPKFPQNKLIIWDDSKERIALQISTTTIILGVRISKSHVVVILQNSIRAYRFKSPLELWHSFETTDNLLALCCLSSDTLVFPGRTPGQVQLVDLTNGNVSIIPAHGSSLRALALSQNGQILATASEIGTLIRVFTTHNCARIVELRRGIDQAVIFSLAISPSGLLLAATSDKSTLHIFDIPNVASQCGSGSFRKVTGPLKVEKEDKKWGFLGRIPMLPRVLSDNYSFSSAQFETLEENTHHLTQTQSIRNSQKGIIGWVNDQTVIVLGAGSSCIWEKFVIVDSEDGRRYCMRDGWKKYLT